MPKWKARRPPSQPRPMSRWDCRVVQKPGQCRRRGRRQAKSNAPEILSFSLRAVTVTVNGSSRFSCAHRFPVYESRPPAMLHLTPLKGAMERAPDRRRGESPAPADRRQARTAKSATVRFRIRAVRRAALSFAAACGVGRRGTGPRRNNRSAPGGGPNSIPLSTEREGRCR